MSSGFAAWKTLLSLHLSENLLTVLISSNRGGRVTVWVPVATMSLPLCNCSLCYGKWALQSKRPPFWGFPSGVCVSPHPDLFSSSLSSVSLEAVAAGTGPFVGHFPLVSTCVLGLLETVVWKWDYRACRSDIAFGSPLTWKWYSFWCVCLCSVVNCYRWSGPPVGFQVPRWAVLCLSPGCWVRLSLLQRVVLLQSCLPQRQTHRPCFLPSFRP